MSSKPRMEPFRRPFPVCRLAAHCFCGPVPASLFVALCIASLCLTGPAALAQCSPGPGEIVIPVGVSVAAGDCGDPLCLDYSYPRSFSQDFLLETIEYPCRGSESCGGALYAFLVPEKAFYFEFTFDFTGTPSYGLPSDASQVVDMTWTGCVVPTPCGDQGMCDETRSVELSSLSIEGTKVCLTALSDPPESCAAFDFCLEQGTDQLVCGGDPTLITKSPPLP